MKHWKIKAACLAAAVFALSFSVCAEDKIQILTKTEEASEDDFWRSSKYLRVILDDNPIAAERIMESYQVMYLKPRESWIEQFIEDEKNSFPEYYDPKIYAFGDEIRCGRVDETVISVRAEYWRNTGGPHPNSEYRGAVFSAQNGQLLSLSDLLIGDGNSGKKLLLMIKNKLEEQYGEYLYPGMSAEEYASLALAKQDSWYLTEHDLVFFFNPDEIAPYAVGMIEVELPYTELGEVMQIQYLESCEALSVEEYGWADGCIMLWNEVLGEVAGWLE